MASHGAAGSRGRVVTRQVIDLPPDPMAARAARRMVRLVLEKAGRGEWVESAELACTELVTNAVLHARTAVSVEVEVRPDELYVAVRDASTDLPLPRRSDLHATTGRGTTLVARLVSQHGVHLDAAGKTVWFTLDDSSVSSAVRDQEDLLSLWSDDLDLSGLDPDQGTSAAVAEAAVPASDPPSTVHLVRLPPTLWLAAVEHHRTLLRELVLFSAEHPPGVDLAAADVARALLDDAVAEAVERAHRAGTARRPLPEDHPGELPAAPEHLTVSILVPPDILPSVAALQDALDLAERLAAGGQLLARPGLPEIVAVRDWACEQVLAQAAGAPAAEWPGTDHARFVVQERLGDEVAGWDLEPVRSAGRPVVAADDSNRIVAVSRAMAATVGWAAEDLVGRRVVTLIPPRLREAHVAGFSRHLTTGHARLLGLPLQLPVLRADGTEIRCGVLIEEAAAAGGRRLYLAWFDPLEPGADPVDVPG